MNRLTLLCATLAGGLAAGCASSSSGAGSGIVFADCYSYHCVGYDEQWQAHVFLRTPSTPAFPGRGEVRLTEGGRPAPRTVDRSPMTAGAIQPAASRTAPASAAASRPPTTTASRP
jgi:hypothetical protein